MKRDFWRPYSLSILIIPALLVGIWIIALPFIPFLRNADASSQGVDEMRADFARNQRRIELIVDYLVRSDYDRVRIWPGQDFANPHGHPQINNRRVERAVVRLGQRGYSLIRKNADAIVFFRWAGRGARAGAVYSINGQTPGEETLEYLVHIEPLSVPGWYFFREDFNEWRLRNRN
ncbi:MAG: hypothetical protein LBE35_06785 [Clostridiales bacterium]|jgi:hypothetical protein|nr:hypothetical protein [Clostridiales bacterium]